MIIAERDLIRLPRASELLLAVTVQPNMFMLLFRYAFAWVFDFVALMVATSEAAYSLGFVSMFPLTFISSAFVPVSSMPSVLRAFAREHPFTLPVDAMRELWLGRPLRYSVWG